MNENQLITVESKINSWKIPKAVKRAVVVMDEKKGEEIVILKLKKISDITDFMIICSGNSARQNSSIANEVEKTLKKELGLKPYGKEGGGIGDWILIDYVDFIIHIFNPQARGKYSLEKFWMDAKRYDFQTS